MLKAICVLKGDNGVSGVVKFKKDLHTISIEYDIKGIKEGKHGFHIHQYGDTSNGCISAGAHFNPTNNSHGAPFDANRHVGDLGNIEAKSDGTARGIIFDSVISFHGQNNIIGRTLVLHADPDDLGRGGFSDSLTTGHAGTRIACGVIGCTTS